jgi:hypothetical protein
MNWGSPSGNAQVEALTKGGMGLEERPGDSRFLRKSQHFLRPKAAGPAQKGLK